MLKRMKIFIIYDKRIYKYREREREREIWSKLSIDNNISLFNVRCIPNLFYEEFLLQQPYINGIIAQGEALLKT